MLKIAVLGSGKGSNFAALLRAIADDHLPVQPVLVASDNAEAGILALASDARIATYIIEEKTYRTKLSPETEHALATRLAQTAPDLVVLAGYMRMIKPPLLEKFPRRIINIHPSLLPAFPGLEAWKQALSAGANETGCTVHYVDSGMDSGEIIAQERVPIHPHDTPETLHARIQEAEHRLLPAIVANWKA